VDELGPFKTSERRAWPIAARPFDLRRPWLYPYSAPTAMWKRFLRVTVGAVCLLGAGLSLLIICATVLGDTPSVPERRTHGVIIGYHRELTGSSMDSLRYYRIVEYVDSSGITQNFRSYSPLVAPTPGTGAVVSVIYSPHPNPKRRHEYIVERRSVLAFLPWMAGVLFVPFAVGGYALMNGWSARELVRRITRGQASSPTTCST
jgi:hypothetical protein